MRLKLIFYQVNGLFYQIPETLLDGLLLLSSACLYKITGFKKNYYNENNNIMCDGSSSPQVCGDVSVWKPSDTTPLVAVAVTKIVESVLVKNNIPGAIAALCVGGKNIGETIAKDKRMKLVSFTGSTAAGQQVFTYLNQTTFNRFIAFFHFFKLDVFLTRPFFKSSSILSATMYEMMTS